MTTYIVITGTGRYVDTKSPYFLRIRGVQSVFSRLWSTLFIFHLIHLRGIIIIYHRMNYIHILLLLQSLSIKPIHYYIMSFFTKKAVLLDYFTLNSETADPPALD